MKLKCPKCNITSDSMMEDEGLLDDCPIVDMMIHINNKTLKDDGYAFECFSCGNETKFYKTKKELKEKEKEWILEK